MPETKQNLFSQIGTVLAYTAAGALDPSSIIKMREAARQNEIERQRLDMQMRENANQEQLRNAQINYYNAMSSSPFIQPGSIPDGMEISAYDVKGRPLVKKSAERIAQEQANAKAKQDEAVRMKKLEGLTGAINFFENKINELPVGEGVQGRLQGAKLQAQGVLQVGESGAKAAAYSADVDGMRSQIARGLGEVGNLNEQEQKYAINLLPKLTDNNETRKQKLQNFKDYIKMKGISSPVGSMKTDIRSEYNKLRASGLSADEAKKRLGL